MSFHTLHLQVDPVLEALEADNNIRVLSEVANILRAQVDLKRQNASTDEVHRLWNDVGTTIDWLCFVTSAIGLVLTLITLLGIVPLFQPLPTLNRLE